MFKKLSVLILTDQKLKQKKKKKKFSRGKHWGLVATREEEDDLGEGK